MTGSPRFLEVYDVLDNLRGDKEIIIYVYTMRVVDDQVLFAADADYPKDDGTVDVYVDDAYEDAPAEDTKHGLQGLCTMKEPYTDK